MTATRYISTDGKPVLVMEYDGTIDTLNFRKLERPLDALKGDWITCEWDGPEPTACIQHRDGQEIDRTPILPPASDYGNPTPP